MKRMPFGITIVFNSEDENANSSIRCNFDPDSNELDESELQYEKHDLHKTETEHEIQDRYPDRTGFITILNSLIVPSSHVLLPFQAHRSTDRKRLLCERSC
jgi:hypothetical protein